MINDRSYDGIPCTCTEECLQKEKLTGMRCSGTWGNTCGCSACGTRSAEAYADSQYDGVDMSEEGDDDGT